MIQPPRHAGPLHRVGPFLIDHSTLRTKKYSLRLDEIAGSRVRRPLQLPMLLVGAAIAGLAWSVGRYLTSSEITAAMVVTSLTWIIGFSYGSLTIVSRQLRETAPVHGFAPTLCKVRDTIDRILTARHP